MKREEEQGRVGTGLFFFPPKPLLSHFSISKENDIPGVFGSLKGEWIY